VLLEAVNEEDIKSQFWSL